MKSLEYVLHAVYICNYIGESYMWKKIVFLFCFCFFKKESKGHISGWRKTLTYSRPPVWPYWAAAIFYTISACKTALLGMHFRKSSVGRVLPAIRFSPQNMCWSARRKKKTRSHLVTYPRKWFCFVFRSKSLQTSEARILWRHFQLSQTKVNRPKSSSRQFAKSIQPTRHFRVR